MTDKTSQLADALRAWAKGDPFVTAAVELLIAHGYWLDDPDFTSRAIERVDADFARIRWAAAEKIITTDSMAGDTQITMLRLAILIGWDQWRLARLDRTNSRIAVDALATALHPQVTR